MRSIKKMGAGGRLLAAAHTNPPHTDEEATRRWKRFRRAKPRVLNYLLEEQYGLCCYTEVRADKLELGYHIEHVQNKSLYPQRTFDYQNLAASALSSDDLHAFKVQGYEAFGGHAAGKQTTYDPNLFISCHRPDCHRFFAYLSDGRVVPASSLSDEEHAKADYTIRQLNLNSPYLTTLRQAWWDELDQLFVEHQAKNWSLPHMVALDLLPAGNKLSQFFSITRHFFGGVAEQILQKNAIGLV
ncbi:MAG: TIGR02646 family protein [Azonexus sp.]|nr:TIGR02646 family protein [Azonexus sp.]